MLRRRTALGLVLCLGLAPPLAAGAEEEPRLGDDGLHEQDWFLESFLEMGPDLEEAAARGKGLMVLFEQRGCPYCRELHRVNFARPELVETLTANFEVVQLDIWGSREVTDFDGETLEERELARKWGVVFTPTVALFPASAAGAASASEAEAFRMPGYFKPFHFESGMLYVASGRHAEIGFQRFLQERFETLEAQGVAPDVW